MSDQGLPGREPGNGERPGVPGEMPTETIIRDALVLQGKLIIDGLRDALLIPVSLVAALISVFQQGPEKGRLFYEVVALGRRSEKWIDLFEAADRIETRVDDSEMTPLDEYLTQVETRIRKEYRDREVTRQARDSIDSLVSRIEAARQRLKDTEGSD